MTRKAALAGLPLGGGKAVVIGDPRQRTREQLLAVGAFVDSLEGRYITAADMGTGEEEMAVIAERTRYVTGLPQRLGGCGGPSPYTALGVHLAIDAALARLGRSLEGARIAIQGVGSVGSKLVEHLLESGASLIVADKAPKTLSGLPDEVEVVEPGAILTVDCDVFSPCGPPSVIDARLVEELRCRVVCGAANNPLENSQVATLLERRGILYVPDFLANAGGVIHLAVALEGGDDRASREHLHLIPENLRRVIDYASAEGVSTAIAAQRLALAALTAGDNA
jgi:glutamate dehydrogenase/leucine dehydrogenase